MRMPNASPGVLRRVNSRVNRSERSRSVVSIRWSPRDRLSVMSWISRMDISSHRSARLIGHIRVVVILWGASRDGASRTMITPPSPSVGTENISSLGSCGSTRSRNTNLRRSTNAAHCGIGMISVATGGLVFDSLMPIRRAPPYAFANATASERIDSFARSPIFSLPSIQESTPRPFAGRVSLNSICSPSGTCESIKACTSPLSICSAGLERTAVIHCVHR